MQRLFPASQRWPRRTPVDYCRQCSMPLPLAFNTAIPYVFSMCSAPGGGWNPPDMAMAASRLSSFLSEEWCPLERLHWQVA
jgi:hypothetical protein